MARVNDGRDLLATYQPGDRAASQRIVQAHQAELLRTCYLLTGDAEHAGRLARSAFIDFFRSLLRGEVTDDPRELLLGAAVRRWLVGDWEKEGGAPSSGVPGFLGPVTSSGPPQRFHVDDERSRVVTALARLFPATHAALVLREHNQLDEETVCRILRTVPHELRRELQPARVKLQEEAGGSHGPVARELLISAATAAPQANVWSELEGPLDELQREEQERRQRYTYAAAALVGLGLLAAALWLFGFFPSGDDGTSAAAPPMATPTAEPTPTPEPSPTPMIDIASLDLPEADVPARLFVQSGSQALNQSEVGEFDPAVGGYRMFDVPGFPEVSPDGRSLIHHSFDPEDNAGPSQTFIVVDSMSGERAWEARIEGRANAWFTMTTDAIYALIIIENELALVALSLETGEEIGRWTDFLDDLPPLYDQRVLLASLDGKRLFIAIDERPVTAEPAARILASFRLPDMTLESVNRQEGSLGPQPFPVGEFSFYTARVTPDGEYVYKLVDDVIMFRNAVPGEEIDVPLQFSFPVPGDDSDLRWTTSNDGRYLYVIATERQEAAVVDLLGRRLVRAFPIDPGEFADSGQALPRSLRGAPGTFFGMNQATISLSPDGSRLYVAGGLPTESGGISEDAALIWALDLATWRVVDRWEVDGVPMHLAAIGRNLYVHAFVPSINRDPQATEPPFRLAVLDTETGDVVSADEIAARPEWAEAFWVIGLTEWYRAEYGRLPAVGGVALDDVEIESTLPRAEIEPSSDAVPVGGTVDIEARIVDPTDGSPLEAGQPDVRFDPDATAVLRLRHEDGQAEDLILIPSRIEPGVYRASAVIEQIGYWSVELTLTSADGSSWTVRHQRVFEGVPSFEATDGKRYILRVETDPAEPVAGQEAELIARFVEVGSGDPLPADESLLKGAPVEMRLMFVITGQGFTSASAERAEDGSYQGTISFRDAGVWTIEATFRFDDGDPARIGAGLVTVNAN